MKGNLTESCGSTIPSLLMPRLETNNIQAGRPARVPGQLPAEKPAVSAAGTPSAAAPAAAGTKITAAAGGQRRDAARRRTRCRHVMIVPLFFFGQPPLLPRPISDSARFVISLVPDDQPADTADADGTRFFLFFVFFWVFLTSFRTTPPLDALQRMNCR